MMEFIMLDFLLTVAGFDAGIVTWQEKRRFDAVRPFSAIRHVYGDEPVTAWGGTRTRHRAGPGQRVAELPPHGGPPGVSVGLGVRLRGAGAGPAALHRRRTAPMAGRCPGPQDRRSSSRASRPAEDLTFRIDTWTDFSRQCGQSRVWGGTHFPPSVDETFERCGVLGDHAYDYFAALVDGTAPEVREALELSPDPRRDDRTGQ